MAWTSVALGVSALAAFLLLHLAAWRIVPPRSRSALGLSVAAGLGYSLTSLGVHFAFHVPFLLHAPVSLPVFLALAVVYFHFYFGLDRSVSVRTLGVLVLSSGGSLGPDELEAQYPQEEMIRRRLGIMLDHGWLTEQDGLYRCAPKARLIARLTRLGTRIYKVDVSG